MHGGKRPGAGRRKGSTNRASEADKVSIEALAREHTTLAFGVLVEVARKGQTEAARVSAANAILDRGYGKPRQSVDAAVGVAVDGAGLRERARQVIAETFGAGSLASSGGGG